MPNLRYMVVCAASVEELQTRISEYVENKWQPTGGLTCRSRKGVMHYYQAIWLPK